MKKIILGILLLFLLMGTACAFDIDDLKPTDNYTDFEDGCADYKTDNHRFLFIEEMDTYNGSFRNNTAVGFMVSDVGDNIYYYEDPLMEQWGYQEIVEIEGDSYMVSINKQSKLSPPEKTDFLNDLKDLNKLNNLTPVKI
jgi:opacity protein-like surface antigen